MKKTALLGVEVTNASQGEILEYIVKNLKNQTENYYITTPNPEIVVYASHHPPFQKVLNASQLALADGVGLLWAAKILGIPLKHRVTGVEVVKKLCEKGNENPITIGFLGGRGNIAELAANRLRTEYPKLNIVLANGWNPTPETAQKLTNLIKNSPTNSSRQNPTMGYLDILFVAYGFPKQEEFMATYGSTLPVKVMIGVGGTLDYLSGTVSRAPGWVQKIGCEWLYRLVLQPWRIKRQMALVEFVYLVLKEKFSRG